MTPAARGLSPLLHHAASSYGHLMKRLHALLIVGLVAGLVACGGDGPHGPVADGNGNGTPPARDTTPRDTAPRDTGGPTENTDDPNMAGMLPRVGESCTGDLEGHVGYMDGGVVTCDGGTVRYALPADLGPTPAGGYTSAPEWYPTLDSLFNSTDVPTDCAPSDVVFTSPVLPSDAISATIPHGLMTGDHVTPIDHMYIGLKSLAADPATLTDADYVPITAPGDGVIVEVSSLGSPTSHRVVMVHGCNVVTVYMVINKVTGVLADYAAEVESKGYVRVNVPVKAGDEFGQQRDNPLDFNLFDGTTWLAGFVSPYSYAMGEPWKPYTTDPLPFFAPDVRAPLEASMQRVTEPRWGKIDHDVLGAAAGNWFLDGTIGYSGAPTDAVANATTMVPGGQVPGKNFYAYGHLSLSPHWVDTTKWVFSTGWWTDPNGDSKQLLIDVGEDQVTPDALTADSGPVAYRLASIQRVDPPGSVPPPEGSRAAEPVGYTVVAGPPQGWVLVQVIDDATIHIEIVTDPNAPPPTAFTDAMRSYHR